MRLSSTALVLLASLSPAIAADLGLSGRIEAVTVFPDGAMVTRKGEIAVPAGSHQILLKGLPSSIDPASIRVEATGTAALVLGTAEVKAVAADTQPTQETQKRLKELRSRLAATKGRIDAAEAEKRAVERLTQVATETAAKDGQGLDLAKAREAWRMLGESVAELNERVRGLNEQAAEIEAEIRAGEGAGGGARSGLPRPMPLPAPRYDLAVAIEAGQETKAAVTVSYRVRDARWTPVYDARLDTSGAKPALELVRRADVMQRTGEDWTEVALTVSTARVARGTAAPELGTQTASFLDPVILQNRARSSAFQADEARRMPAAPVPPAAVAEAEPKVAAVEQEARAEASAFPAAFVAPGRISVPQDGSRRAIRLSSRAYEPELIARAVPAQDTTAYLSGSFVLADELPLLPGEVSLTRDGAFVGKGRIALTAAGDRVDLGFGADDRIKVERVPLRRRDNDPSWVSSARTQLVDMKTTVTNLHARPMKVQVVDRVPVSENTAIVVETLRETTPPTEKQIADKRGVMGWTMDLAPGEKREVRLAWRMKWPADRELVLGE